MDAPTSGSSWHFHVISSRISFSNQLTSLLMVCALIMTLTPVHSIDRQREDWAAPTNGSASYLSGVVRDVRKAPAGPEKLFLPRRLATSKRRWSNLEVALLHSPNLPDNHTSNLPLNKAVIMPMQPDCVSDFGDVCRQ